MAWAPSPTTRPCASSGGASTTGRWTSGRASSSRATKGAGRWRATSGRSCGRGPGPATSGAGAAADVGARPAGGGRGHAPAGRRCRPAAARRGQGGRRATPPVALRQLRGARAAQPAGGCQGADRARQPRPQERSRGGPWGAGVGIGRRGDRDPGAARALSRAEAGRLDAGQEPFDLREAAAAGVERLRAQGSEREVRVAAHGEPVVLGDRGPDRAGDHQPADQCGPLLAARRGGRRRDRRPPRAATARADAGPGIPDEVADVLFHERVGSGRGLGLGLFLVNAAMQAQGGSVRLEERRPRASFVLAWPPRRGDRRPQRSRASGRQRVTEAVRARPTYCGCATRSSRTRPNRRTISWRRSSACRAEQVVRFDMNTLGGGPLPAVSRR